MYTGGEQTSNDGEPGAVDTIKPTITVVNSEGKNYTAHDGVLTYVARGRGVNKHRGTLVEVQNPNVDINFT